MSEPSIIELCRQGDFPEAQRQLEIMGEQCVNEPNNFALCSAYADLCSVFAYYTSIRAGKALAQ